MENCLVQKLFGTVQGKTLLKIGEILFSYAENSNPNYANSAAQNTQRLYIEMPAGESCTINAISGGFKALNSGGQTDLASPQSGRTLNFDCTPETVCVIDNKYKIVNLSGPVVGTGLIMNIDDLAYTETLETLEAIGEGVTGNLATLGGKPMLTVIIDDSKIAGNISHIPNKTNIISFRAGNCKNLYGDISSLNGMENASVVDLNGTGVTGNLSNLTAQIVRLFLSGTSVFGRLEPYIQSYWSRGKRSGTLNIYLSGVTGAVTLNEKRATADFTITFSNSNVVVSSSNTGFVGTGTWDGSSWVYTGVYQ